jgi:hypothetical protein
MKLERREVIAGLSATVLGAATARAEEQRIMDESAARKARSEAILAREEVPFIAHLPMLETVAQTRFRSTEAAADRAICLLLVSGMGETGDYNLMHPFIDEWSARPHLSPAERAFLDSREPTQHDRVQFSWRYEGLSALVWSLGFPHEIGRPDHIADVGALVGMMRDLGPDRFRANARLRDGAEILDVLDLTYRYHWAVVDARLNGRQAPAGLDGGVVMERHYALNWLTSYGDQDWDDVSTDT